MENYTIVLVLLGAMVLLTVFAEKLKVPIPIFLVIAGIAIGFIPGIPVMEIGSEMVFLLFLPPLLYDAAFKINPKEFKANLAIISRLAFSLVFITTIGIAVTAHFLIPGMGWPSAFILGAILAPTDAVSAINITKGMNLSSTANTILEGESLINDASALVAFKFALAALGGATFVLWQASLSFVVLLAGGFLVGFLTARLLQVLLVYVRKNNIAVLSLILLSPFVTYLIAEYFHTSGIIAVVTLALSISRLSTKHFSDKWKQDSETIWDMITFLLNGLIFILIGLELPIVLKEIPGSVLVSYTIYAFIITLIALLLRMIAVFSHRKKLNKAFHSTHPRFANRRIPESILLTVQDGVMISWSGMRGIISLALAIGLPSVMENGNVFLLKSDIIYITTTVVLFTIIGQGVLLPYLSRLTR